MTKSHKIINTTCATKGPLLAAVLVFRLSNFGRDTERGIELTDIVCLRTIASGRGRPLDRSWQYAAGASPRYNRKVSTHPP
jgi:hypothetical protein